jgi:PAS domain S-box-containing protein
MKNIDNPSEDNILRQNAEDIIKKKITKKNAPFSEVEILFLVNELEIHQIELEMQNEELMFTKKQAEMSTEKYAELYDFAPSGYVTLSKESKILELNLNLAKIIGKERSHLTNNSFGFFISDDTKSIFNLFIDKIFRTLTKESCEVTLITVDNLQIPVHLTGVVSENEEQCFITVVDITERKLAENLLQETNAYLENLINHANAPIIVWDPQFRITRFNHAFESLTGRNEMDVIGQPLEILFPTDQVKNTMELINKTSTGEHWETVEIEIIHKDQSKRTLLWNSATLFNQNDQTPVATIAQGHDITKRKLTEEALLKSESFAKATLDALSAHIAILDETGKILAINHAWRAFGESNSPIDTYGKAIENINYLSVCKTSNGTNSEEASAMAEGIYAVLNGEKKEFSLEYPCHSTTEKRWFNARVTHFSKEGDSRIVVAHENITERKLTEQALIESEKFLKETQIIAKLGTYTLEIDSGKWKSSEIMDSIFGIDANFNKSVESWLAIIHPDWRKMMLKYLTDEVIGKKTKFDQEYKIIRQYNQEERWVHGLGELIFNDKNEPIKMIGTIEDITQNKQSSLELNKINRVYSLISQINNLILRSKDREELFREICHIAVVYGKFRMCWIGLLDEERKIIKTAAFDGFEDGYFTKSMITTILDVPEGRGPTGTAMREGRTVICNDIANDPIMTPWREEAIQRGYYSSISIPIVVRNTIIGSFNLYSEEKNSFSSQEEIALLEKITQNVAFTLESILIEEERKHDEQKIRQLSQAVEQSPVTIVITNTKGEIEYANAKFVETTGYSLDEVIGQNPRFLKSGYTSPDEYEKLWQNLADGKEWHGEFYNKRKDGTLYWEASAISPIIDAQGHTTHYIAIKEDITDHKRIEEELIKAKERAEESDRLKSAFLANMSHEIRTPMNGILGFAELLKEPNLSGEDEQEYIRIIQESGERMLNIINDIIDISKIESKQMKVSPTETNINEKIEYIFNFFKPEVANKGIHLVYKNGLLAKESIITTDSEKVYAILTNLVKNAIKFTDEGTIEFGYTLQADSKPAVLEFFVKDTGVGVPKEKQQAIFDRFIQANITDKRAFQGAGLGLSISKAYVEMLGGKIWVESEEGKGSTFYFTIPYNREPKKETAINKIVPEVKEENQIKDLKILIVEDDKISNMLISKAIKPFSKEILKAVTGIEAVEICSNNPDLDLVMMDVNMPVMNGLEATKQIREFNKNVIIIAQTAYGMSSDREEAINAGCNDYISKPININTLGSLIQKYFDKEVVSAVKFK